VQGLDRQIAEIEDDRKRLESRIESLAATERDLRERTDRFATEAAGAKETAGREEEELARIEGELAGKRIVAEECKTRALELMKGESERKAEWEGARERLAAAAERHLSARGMVEELEGRVASLEGEFSTLHAEKEHLAGRLREVTESLDAARSASEEADGKLNEATELETERREKLTRLRTRIETLEDLKESMEGLDEGVKLILQEPDRSGARGVVADFLDVDSGSLDAVEALIGPLLGAAVVESEKEADAALGLLSERAAGHASIVVLGRGRGAQSLRTLNSGEKGIAGWVRESVRAADGADGLIEVLVGDAVLVETPEDAVRLSATYPGHRFVSRSGVVWNGGVVSGGRPSDADRGLLRRGQELKGLLAEREAAESGFAEAGERKLEWVRRRDERAQQLEKIEEERGQLAETLRAQETRVEGVEKQLRSNREELDTRETEARSSEAEEKTLSASLAQAETDLSQLSQEASDSSRKLGQLEEEVRTLEHSRQELASRTNRVRDEWMEVSSRHAEASADLARVEAELRELREAASARVREVGQARERQRQTSDEHQALTGTLAERRSEEKTIREAAEGAVERTKAARQSLEIEEKTVAEVRLKQSELNEYVHQIEVERLTLRGDLEKTLERLRVEYDINLVEFKPEPLPEGQTWDSAAATERLEYCRERYGSLGPVNDLALDEYNTKKQRHDFLTTQRDDLNEAKGQLLEAIEKINTTASKLFEETFHKVEKNFQETFRTLFDGGECSLRRMGDDPLECEIEISAKPRGKSLQSILLLSGGERALTAIALLFAIYLVKPSPFCILDEVDAPLDDANIDRFVRMLQRFSDHTQFIIVTHNKKTMEIAESLYGVTMQEPGVSRLVSVRLEKAESGNGHVAAEAAETNSVSSEPRAVTVRTEENGGRKVKTELAPVVPEPAPVAAEPAPEPEVTLAGSPGNGKK
jgi:chromosome segregation protein